MFCANTRVQRRERSAARRRLGTQIACMGARAVRATMQSLTACPLELAVLILSRPGDAGAEQRQATRSAWAHWPDPCEARFWFLLGGAPTLSVADDVLYLPVPEGCKFPTSAIELPCPPLHLPSVDRTISSAGALVDTDTKISLKVLHGFRWLVHQHGGFRHVLKTDDDSFVCVGSLLSLLRAAPSGMMYAGKPNWQHRKVRVTMASHKWYDAAYAETFERTVYGDYHQGAGYLLSEALARGVVRTAHRLGVLTNSSKGSAVEDAWLGALARAPGTGLLPRQRNRSDSVALAREPEIPIALNVAMNVSASCRGDYVIVHKMVDGATLRHCARAMAASPPLCKPRFGSVAQHLHAVGKWQAGPRCPCTMRPAPREARRTPTRHYDVRKDFAKVEGNS